MTTYDFTNVKPTEFIEPDEPTTEAITPEFDEPDKNLLQEKKRSRTAKEYEKKLRELSNVAFRATVNHPATLPDAAAIIMYAPQIAEKWGDLADADARVKRGIDMITDGTENPYAAAILSTLPLVMQFVRNHEPVLEPQARGIRIPFTKRVIPFRFKLGIKLGKLRNMTEDPANLMTHVFENSDIKTALEKQGIKVARANTP